MPMNLASLLPILLVLSTLHAQKEALDLFHLVRDQEPVSLAPNGIIDVLGLHYYGSDGSTEETFRLEVFNNRTRDDVAEAAAQTVRELPGYRNIGAVWFSPRVNIEQDFLTAALIKWQLHIDRAPFTTDIPAATKQINSWFGQRTNGMVPVVVTEADLSAGLPPDMVSVVVTAFVSPWKNSYFSRSDTSRQLFYKSPEENFEVDMMHTKSNFGYFENDDLKAVLLHYKAEQIGLMLMMPMDPNGFDTFVSDLTYATFSGIYSAMPGTHNERVKLALPKVDFATSRNWRSIFIRKGITKPFLGEANFSRINNNNPEPIYISHLKQLTKLQWNEWGTKAISVTTALDEPFGSLPEPKTFIANRPFVYFIFNKDTRDILFMGIINSQSQMPRADSE